MAKDDSEGIPTGLTLAQLADVLIEVAERLKGDWPLIAIESSLNEDSAGSEPIEGQTLNEIEADALNREMWSAPAPTEAELKEQLDAAKLRNYTLTQAISTLEWENEKLQKRIKDIRRKR